MARIALLLALLTTTACDALMLGAPQPDEGCGWPAPADAPGSIGAR